MDAGRRQGSIAVRAKPPRLASQDGAFLGVQHEPIRQIRALSHAVRTPRRSKSVREDASQLASPLQYRGGVKDGSESPGDGEPSESRAEPVWEEAHGCQGQG